MCVSVPTKPVTVEEIREQLPDIRKVLAQDAKLALVVQQNMLVYIDFLLAEVDRLKAENERLLNEYVPLS